MKLPVLTTVPWELNSINKTVDFVYIIIMTRIKPFFLLAIATLLAGKTQAQLPPGFDYTLFSDQVPGVTTLEFAENGNIYACDFSGKIWLFEDGVLQPEPVIDISDEVAGYGDLHLESNSSWREPRFAQTISIATLALDLYKIAGFL